MENGLMGFQVYDAKSGKNITESARWFIDDAGRLIRAESLDTGFILVSVQKRGLRIVQMDNGTKVVW